MKRRSGDWHDTLCMFMCGLCMVATVAAAVFFMSGYPQAAWQKRLDDTRKKGFLAAEMGMSELSCPYKDQTFHEAWLEGYMQSIAKKRSQE